jgi:hypothetical protein
MARTILVDQNSRRGFLTSVRTPTGGIVAFVSPAAARATRILAVAFPLSFATGLAGYTRALALELACHLLYLCSNR